MGKGFRKMISIRYDMYYPAKVLKRFVGKGFSTLLLKKQYGYRLHIAAYDCGIR
jgi:hypothetical protein